MMTLRNKVMADIASVEKKLYEQQAQYIDHKQYFDNVSKDNRVLLLSLLLPSFMMGWKCGRKGRVKLLIKQLLNVGIVTLVSRLKS